MLADAASVDTVPVSWQVMPLDLDSLTTSLLISSMIPGNSLFCFILVQCFETTRLIEELTSFYASLFLLSTSAICCNWNHKKIVHFFTDQCYILYCW